MGHTENDITDNTILILSALGLTVLFDTILSVCRFLNVNDSYYRDDQPISSLALDVPTPKRLSDISINIRWRAEFAVKLYRAIKTEHINKVRHAEQNE